MVLQVEIDLTQGMYGEEALKIVFGWGDEESNEVCWDLLLNFVRRGDERKRVSYQSQFQKVEKVVGELWAAAIAAFSYPVYVVINTLDTNASTFRSGRQARNGVQSPYAASWTEN